jgi:hypothetical protein
MPRYTFLVGEASITAANRAEALVLCQQGLVVVNAIVVQHGDKKDFRFPISHDRELHLAVCAAKNIPAPYPDRIPKLGTIFLVVAVFCAAIAVGFIYEWAATESSKRTAIESLRNIGAFALLAGFFLNAFCRELRHPRSEATSASAPSHPKSSKTSQRPPSCSL